MLWFEESHPKLEGRKKMIPFGWRVPRMISGVQEMIRKVLVIYLRGGRC